MSINFRKPKPRQFFFFENVDKNFVGKVSTDFSKLKICSFLPLNYIKTFYEAQPDLKKKKKKKLNPSNYFISWATFQTICISSNSSLIDSILLFKNALENRVWDTRFSNSSFSHSIFKYIFKWQIDSTGLEWLKRKII